MDAKIKRVYVPMTETGFYILFCLQKEMHGYNITQKVKEMTRGRQKLDQALCMEHWEKWKRMV